MAKRRAKKVLANIGQTGRKRKELHCRAHQSTDRLLLSRCSTPTVESMLERVQNGRYGRGHPLAKALQCKRKQNRNKAQWRKRNPPRARNPKLLLRRWPPGCARQGERREGRETVYIKVNSVVIILTNGLRPSTIGGGQAPFRFPALPIHAGLPPPSLEPPLQCPSSIRVSGRVFAKINRDFFFLFCFLLLAH